MSRIYLDHAATTPLRPEAREAMLRGFELWANPSSPHAEGRAARAALEDARERVKAAFGWEGEVIFTSGASEASERVFDYADVLFQFATAAEHDAIHSHVNYIECEEIPVLADGSADLDWLSPDRMPRAKAGAFQEGRSLVAIQHVNSETGNRQSIDGARELVRQRGGLLLVDCAQSAGKYALPDCDLAIVSAHKFGGPIGIGALLLKDFTMLKPSGGQERGYRRGTENMPGALGMAAALAACGDPYLDPDVLAPLDSFAGEVRSMGGAWLADRLSDPIPYILPVAMPRLTGSAQIMRFDMAGISLSQGSACSSGTMKPSRVLEAMGVPGEEVERAIRVSFGWTTTRQEVERFCETWLEMAREAAERVT
jgi:cysteine desulfurase